MSGDAYPDPLTVTVFDTAVMVTCPRASFMVALTPAAARDTARSLADAAAAAERVAGLRVQKRGASRRPSKD